MVKTYRALPVQVQALQWMIENEPEFEEFLGGFEVLEESTGYFKKLTITTSDGTTLVNAGDFVVKNHLGQLYAYTEQAFMESFVEDVPEV